MNISERIVVKTTVLFIFIDLFCVKVLPYKNQIDAKDENFFSMESPSKIK